MKKLLLFCFVLFNLTSLIAGHNETVRSRCRFFSPKYKAQTHISVYNVSLLCWQVKTDCNEADAICTFGCASAYSHAGNIGVYGSASTCGAYIAAINRDITYSIANYAEFDEDYQEDQSGSYIPEFLEEGILLSNLKIRLNSNLNSNKINDYEIRIWRPVDETEEDDNATSEKTVLYGKVSIQRGQMRLEGNLFEDSEFEILTEGEYITVNYIGGDKFLDLNESQDLAVSSNGDIKFNESDLLDIAIDASKNVELNYELEITTGNGGNVIYVRPLSNTPKMYSYTIFDVLGSKIESGDMISNANDTNVEINIPHSVVGLYYLVISDGKDKIVKRLVKVN